MKKNHLRTANLVNQALASIGDDFAMQEARRHLLAAMNSLSEVGRKRAKRHSAAIMYREKALKKNEEWWEMIRENTLKMAEMAQQPEPSKDS